MSQAAQHVDAFSAYQSFGQTLLRDYSEAYALFYSYVDLESALPAVQVMQDLFATFSLSREVASEAAVFFICTLRASLDNILHASTLGLLRYRNQAASGLPLNSVSVQQSTLDWSKNFKSVFSSDTADILGLDYSLD